MTEEIEKVIRAAVKETVNGRIDKLRDEQIAAHQSLHLEIDQVRKSIREVLDAFEETSGFFKVSMKIAKYITVLGGAITILWVLAKNVKP